ncbi:uncharacterized protein K460DRAFT_357305 [Cucurbitaria berberidis CBS 394.84]|uniref:Uncharacterized protein n=1 Tax=Cucurbitaria berberidis CBS 394.84 TaxID=1168544 RepID=A0A9P4GDQ0_9PLEO|nr:uncharacterized protein K460DRAFT_357305 [Cucurbitaria berberidis CBS 394.84]KAF1843599.1 hypothetical protein K460DRAFT_357305 [Cucurbitaria berberidis CBS 394.84]
MTADTSGGTQRSVMKKDFFIYGISNGTSVEKLLCGSQFFSGSMYLFECSMNSVLVEANVACASNSCETKRLRRLATPRWERNQTHLPYNVVHNGIPSSTSSLTLLASEETHLFSSLIPSMPTFTALLLGVSDRNGTKTELDRIYWSAPEMYRDVAPTDQVTEYVLGCLTLASGYNSERPICKIVEEYNYVTAPDILDCTSSFTRDNPYIKAPAGGSGLHGAERARLLRKIKVQLGEVNPTLEIGYIVIKSVEGEKDGQQSRNRRGRMYR